MHKIKPSIGVIDVGIGNIKSVGHALDFLNYDVEYCKTPDALIGKTHIVLPGVGAFKSGMDALAKADMIAPLKSFKNEYSVRILGICLGMQLLGSYGAEGECEGLSLMDFQTEHLSNIGVSGLKVPNVGFSEITNFIPTGIFSDIDPKSDVYFTHSYCVRKIVSDGNVALSDHNGSFVAGFQLRNVCGVQFHPEKSQAIGLKLLKNFIEI